MTHDPHRFESGSKALSVRVDNSLNFPLFIGRIIHFSLQFYGENFQPEAPGASALGRLSRRAREFGNVDGDALDLIFQTWLTADFLVADREIGLDWSERARVSLREFVAASNERTEDYWNPERAVEFLRFLDETEVGGPSSELLCFMNPHWRRAGFIYNSPFDGVTHLQKSRVSGVFSRLANLKSRALYPPQLFLPAPS